MKSLMKSLSFPFPVVSWDEGEVVLIDQTLLPEQLAWRRCSDIPALCRAIYELAVRGAPAIGVGAAFGLAMHSNTLTEFNGRIVLIVPAAKNKHIARGARPLADIYLVIER